MILDGNRCDGYFLLGVSWSTFKNSRRERRHFSVAQGKILTQFSLVLIDPNCVSPGRIPGALTTLVRPGAWDGQGYTDKLKPWTLGVGSCLCMLMSNSLWPHRL